MYNIQMPVPYAEIKWIKDRLDRVEKQLAELSKTQSLIRARALKLAESTLESDILTDRIFTDRCDLQENAILALVERVIGLEAKVLPELKSDMGRLNRIIGLHDGPPVNPLDTRKKRKPK
jgi:hypothetical protein